MIRLFTLLVLTLGFISCTKCHLKGNELLNESFDSEGDWYLISDISNVDDIYSRVEDGMLKMKTFQGYNCNRATYYFDQDFSDIKGFEACIHIKEFYAPKKVNVHFYISLGEYVLHASINQRKTKNTALKLIYNDKGIRSNLKGAMVGFVDQEELKPDTTILAPTNPNFIQISLCPESWEDSTGELYIAIDGIEIVTL